MNPVQPAQVNFKTKQGATTIGKTPQVATPSLIPNGGTYPTSATSVNIRMSCATPGASMRYTLDGSIPDAINGTLYTGGFVNIAITTTVKVCAFLAGYANSNIASALFTLNKLPIQTPIFFPNGGTHTGAQNVSIDVGDIHASVRYTLDSSTPTETHGTLYTAIIPVNESVTIKAIGYRTGYPDSAVSSAPFTITSPHVATPVISPSTGIYNSTQSATITCATPGASIFYTLDGSTPTGSSTPYTGAISISSTTTIKAIATHSGYSNSAIAESDITISQPTVDAPQFSIPQGTYYGPQYVAITCTTPGSSIRYTTDGSIPNGSSALYTSPILVSSSETLSAIAFASGYISSYNDAIYTISDPLKNGLIMFCPLTSGPSDTSGNGNNLTEHGAAITYGANGAVFNGIDNYLALNAGIVPLGNSSVTIAAIVNLTDLSTYHQIFSVNSQLGALVTSSGVLISQYFDGSGNQVNVTDSDSFGNGPITSGASLIMAFTFDQSTGIAKQYIGGVVDASGVNNSIILNTGSPFLLGAFGYSGPVVAELFNGTIKNAAAWSRVLSSAEISTYVGGWTP